MALAEAGFIVDAVCLPDHPVSKTTVVNRIYTYRALAPLASFADAIGSSKPDLLLPCDDPASEHLQGLHGREFNRNQKATLISSVVERSIGPAEAFPVLQQRAKFMSLAQQEGVRVPRTQVISQASDLAIWGSAVGFPTVLKANGTNGGDGVRVVHSLKDAERAYRILHSAPPLARAIKRAMFSEDPTLFRPWIRCQKPVVNAQAFVSGRDATTLVACWQGTVLASLHFEVLYKRYSSGPASVLRWIENDEMKTASEKMVRRLGLSGLHGFDFMIEANAGNAYLIEINPRVTQVGHLTLGPGRDLPAALFAAVTGNSLQTAPKITEKDTIAIFPSEWVRNPNSEFLTRGYHDVPWSQPALLLDTLAKRNKQRPWKSRRKLFQLFSPARSHRG